MTATFMPLAFKAVDGAVLFEGRKLSDLRAIAARHRLTSEALRLERSEKAATIFWALRNQLAKAIEQARQQRRQGFRLITNTHPLDAA